MGETGTYHLFQSGGAEPRAGLMPTPPGAAGPPCWLPYIQVTDVDAIAARVPDLGGKVFVAPQDIPGVGRFSVAADPTGAMIAFLTPAVAPQG
jgi:predicted enzyme related to lactoylglutathione lyase